MQPGKSIKIFINYFLGPLLFAWLAYAIYRQIMKQPQLEESWLQIQNAFQSHKIVYLFAALALIVVNWGLEAWKWMISVRIIYPVKFLQAFKAVLSGVSFSVTMPNRVGDYVGRMMYLPEGNRLKAISITLVGSFAQLLITLLTGTIGIIALKPSLLNHFPELRIWFQFIVYGLLVLILVMLLIYFNAAATVDLFRRWIKNKKYIYLIEALQYFNVKLLLRILLLSFLRYIVFLVQYILVFYLFEVKVEANSIALAMSVVFLAMAIIPSISLIEVWLRGEISIQLVGIFSQNLLGIGFASVTIWFINLVIPAIAGSLFMLSLRVFRK